MKIRLGSLRQRLLACLLLVWALGAAAMAAYLEFQAVTPEEVLEAASLKTQARVLAGAMQFSPSGQYRAIRIPPHWRSVYASPTGGFYALYDPSGRLAAQSANLPATLPLATLPAGQSVSRLRLVGPDQLLAVSARAPHGYWLMVARTNPTLVDEAPAEQLEDLTPGLIFAAAALVGLMVAWWVSKWSLRPLKQAAVEAGAIGPDSPLRLSAERLPVEVQGLAKAVNRALDRVMAAYANEKRFTAEAAHALRTPLAVLDLRLQRAEAEGQVDWPAVRADLAELTRMISGLLTLARADRSRTFREASEVNLTRLAREAAASIAPALERAGRSIELSGPEGLTVQGDRGELFELAIALLDNALAHGRGHIRVELARQGSQAVLRVADEGEGVPPEARELVFERFHTLDPVAGGAGLGLAIARQTARAHGGDARFLDGGVVEVVLAA